MSLLDQGWLDKPCAPLLLVNGKKDEQVPIEDLYLLVYEVYHQAREER